MQPRIKFGLIVGGVGLFVNLCASAAVGLCGPFVALLAGALAGFLAAQQEKLPAQSAGAKVGATAGGLAGGLMIIGQSLGAVVGLALLQTTGGNPFVGSGPSTGAPVEQAAFYLSGFGAGCCMGIFGAALAAGAAAGYFATPPAAPAQPPASFSA
jgi:hypothetical protein